MEAIENEIRDIFNKRIITDRDVNRANDLLRVWKHWMKWEENTTNPIKAL